jgi:glycosyltransferase involved in cell wall biosynthesis
MTLLYFSPSSFGGIADYSHEQANALADAGADVEFLTTPAYPTGRGERYRLRPDLLELKPPQPIASRAGRAARYVRVTLSNIRRLTQAIERTGARRVLFGCYAEYLAPLWVGPLRRLAERGVVFGAVVHDPVRDFALGPAWWHRMSVSSAYSFLREAFVHEAVNLDTVKPMPRLRTTVVPFGLYNFPPPAAARDETRRRLNLPLDAPVILAFGNIRDGKNLDLALKALAEATEPYLIVAGTAQSSGQKPPEFYRRLARDLGIERRCRWLVEYVSATQAANLFEASDVTLLTYSRSFRSASSVLSLAANYRKPCLASGGDGPLLSMVRKYRLGVWVEPDDANALAAGIRTWMQSPPTPDWTRFLAENSWAVNARLVKTCMEEASPSSGRRST